MGTELTGRPQSRKPDPNVQRGPPAWGVQGLQPEGSAGERRGQEATSGPKQKKEFIGEDAGYNHAMER